jgi:hypothetical protein
MGGSNVFGSYFGSNFFGCLGKSAMSKMPHRVIKKKEGRMLRYEYRYNHEGLGFHYNQSTHAN